MNAKTRKRKQQLFLKHLADGGNVSAAATLAVVAKPTLYRWQKRFATFAEDWQVALDQAADALEAEARRRAVDGVEYPVYQGGVKVGTIRRYSDVLLIFLLKGARPGKYRDRSDVNFNDNEKIPMSIGFDFSVKNEPAKVVESAPPALLPADD